MDTLVESYRKVIADLRQLAYFAGRDGDVKKYQHYQVLWHALYDIHPHPLGLQEARSTEPGEGEGTGTTEGGE